MNIHENNRMSWSKLSELFEEEIFFKKCEKSLKEVHFEFSLKRKYQLLPGDATLHKANFSG